MKKIVYRFVLFFSTILFYSCSDPEDALIVTEESETELNSELLHHEGFIEISSDDVSFNLEEKEIIEKVESRVLADIGTDWSGLIQVKVFSSGFIGGPWRSQWTVSQSVDPGWVCVGGGADLYYTGAGALLTASYPSLDKKSWNASSKDHAKTDLHRIAVYAVGLKIQGVSESELKSYITITSDTSVVTNHPFAHSYVPNNSILIGGGAKVNLNGGYGNLLTASAPQGASSVPYTANYWRAASKDHLKSNPTSITSYSIAIRKVIPNFGEVESQVFFTAYSGVSNGVSSVTASISSSDYAFIGFGARTTYSGAGRMLCTLRPAIDGGSFANKDHLTTSNGGITAYIVGLKKKP